VRDLEIEEMPLGEKYDKLYDQYILSDVVVMAFVKEKELTNEFMDYSMSVYKKMMPLLMGPAFKLIKILAPGRAFKKFVELLYREGQITEPLSNIEIISLSDREAIIKYNNSVMLKKYRDVLKKTGIDLNLEEHWELFRESGKEMIEELGFDMIPRIEEDSTITTIKLK
jgi:hypothetical protein